MLLFIQWSLFLTFLACEFQHELIFIGQQMCFCWTDFFGCNKFISLESFLGANITQPPYSLLENILIFVHKRVPPRSWKVFWCHGFAVTLQRALIMVIQSCIRFKPWFWRCATFQNLGLKNHLKESNETQNWVVLFFEVSFPSELWKSTSKFNFSGHSFQLQPMPAPT